MRVCYKLRREIEDLFPPKTTAAERLVGGLIADRARRATRRALIAPEYLESRTGLTPGGINDTLARLRDKRGLEFRVILGHDKNGHPYYAIKGISPEYRVPGIEEFKTAWEMTGHVFAAIPSGPWLTAI